MGGCECPTGFSLKKCTGLSIISYLNKHIIYSLKVNNIGISLPVMGCAGIFSTCGVLDSAGNAKVSFVAEKSENNLLHFFITHCPNIILSKHNQQIISRNLFCIYPFPPGGEQT